MQIPYLVLFPYIFSVGNGFIDVLEKETLKK